MRWAWNRSSPSNSQRTSGQKLRRRSHWSVLWCIQFTRRDRRISGTSRRGYRWETKESICTKGYVISHLARHLCVLTYSHLGLQTLRRYFELIVFQSYLQSTKPDTMQSFESVETFVKNRPGMWSFWRCTIDGAQINLLGQSSKHLRKSY